MNRIIYTGAGCTGNGFVGCTGNRFVGCTGDGFVGCTGNGLVIGLGCGWFGCGWILGGPNPNQPKQGTDAICN